MIERIIELIAPHQCLACGHNNNIFCANCLAEKFCEIATVCAMCSGITELYKVCANCQESKLNRVYIAAEYKYDVAKLIKDFKFHRAKAAYKPLASAIDATVSYLPRNTVVVPVPTSLTHIRQRGYDHAYLVAKEFARLRGLKMITPLYRSSDQRQVGASKKERFLQAKSSICIKPGQILESNVILIDDVCTTGASLYVAANLLRVAGAGQIDAAVVAWQAPTKKD
ncbi:MAG TPA: hypothetical protein VLA77_00735 [Candidatus Saccharimonadales bacterium]|nr:hypothetical protein [Candidatus Saccharimonadales bacterium]